MSITQDKTRVIKKVFKKNGMENSAINSDDKYNRLLITNDHAFYELIRKKMFDGDITIKQYDYLYKDISEKMGQVALGKESFDIKYIINYSKSINQLDNTQSLFTEDELKNLISKNNQSNTDSNFDIRKTDKYIKTNNIKNVKISSYKSENVQKNNNDTLNKKIIFDSDGFYKFLIKKRELNLLVSTYIHHINYIFSSKRLDSKDLIEKFNYSDKNITDFFKKKIPQNKNLLKEMAYISKKITEELEKMNRSDQKKEKINNFLNKSLSKTINQEQYNMLYEEISKNLVNTIMSIKDIVNIYSKHLISEPTNTEFKKLLKKQDEKIQPYIYETKTGLKFQKKISIHFNSKLVFNIDIFSGKEIYSDDLPNENEIRKSLTDVLILFDKTFGLKTDNIPFKGDANQANFRLFLFEDAQKYKEFFNRHEKNGFTNHVGFAQGAELSYISNMYVNTEKTLNDSLSTIKHEFVHALTFYATGKMGIKNVFLEGIAMYIAGLSERKTSTDFVSSFIHSVKGKVPKDLSLKNIMNPEYFKENQLNSYTIGPALIAYFEEKNLYFIENLFDAIKYDKKNSTSGHYFNQMMKNIYKEEENNNNGFQKWVDLKLEANSKRQKRSFDNQPNLLKQEWAGFDSEERIFTTNHSEYSPQKQDPIGLYSNRQP
ncbi:hypothetical protein BJP41_06155 [Candidatus Williamhamiltonella defendens]|uniref:Uncharacterized protein n=1 Tax=Candidatus Williamhamiltonella defendens TaxID=138072 RepID=A0A2D3T818_9ENTR|nr:hypothetical protein [Candidatus Hamiltonella defensa]ATW29980.1 hypothetical protein BJP41_06155 [Candidatus Hamiltonella defensa]ATW31955.1 hypothetical protein BJP42_06255 [Candidatus Hamiltonella defensa]